MTRRVVGAIRVSRMRDESTSPEVQDDKVRGWTSLHDGSLVGIAVDKDVSGKTVSPWDRPELGYWLARPHLFDFLVVPKIDRVCRNAEDFMQLVRWGKEHGVALVFIAEGIDLSTPGGELAAKIIALVAEWDWERIRENTLDGQRKAIGQGRFKGGVAPLGYRAVKETRNGIAGTWLVVDEDDRVFVKSLVRWVIEGNDSITAICDAMNARGELTSSDRHRVKMGKEPRGAQWSPGRLLDMLRSRSLLGEYRTRDNSTIRDETGLPISKAEPILTIGEWTDLQAALEKVSKKKLLKRADSSMLQGVLNCGICSSPMWHMDTRGRWQYYRCSAKKLCGNTLAPAGALEKEFSQSFEAAFKDVPMVREVISPSEDHSEDIAALQEKIDNLAGNLSEVKPGSAGAAATLKLLQASEVSLEALRALPEVQETRTYEETGESMIEVWSALSDSDKGIFMRDHGVVATWSKPKGSDKASMVIVWGNLQEVRDRLSRSPKQ